jgi:hypothetical protein
MWPLVFFHLPRLELPTHSILRPPNFPTSPIGEKNNKNSNNNNNNNFRRESRKPVLCDCFELLNSSCWTVLSEGYIEFCIASWGAQKVIPCIHVRCMNF